MPARPKKNYKSEKKRSGQFRVIGGSWRSRRLSFPDIDGLRPTTDRVRETVFNWLSADVPGSKVLDLFGGSGSLGFEALSRGAEQLLFVEMNRDAVQALRDNIALLGANAEVVQNDALAWLRSASNSFDLVFLDPPFRQDLLAPAIALLDERAIISTGAKVYIEQESEAPLPETPSQWRLVKEAKAGQVSYLLYEISARE